MRLAIITAFLASALPVMAASAAETHVAPIQSEHSLYTCSGGALSRVAFTPAAAPCCAGQLGCPQLLSNTGLIKPRPDNRT